MAPISSPPSQKLGSVLVIGGCGFLGSHIVNLLLTYTKETSISVLDLFTTRNRRPESDNISYHDGDITKLSDLLSVFGKVKPDVVIHTASPNLMGASNDLYYKVNVEGTQRVIEACQQTGVKCLVYTSSASVISDTIGDLINADERWPVIPEKLQKEYYSTTKVFLPSLFPPLLCLPLFKPPSSLSVSYKSYLE
jgi:sterol-4alpha-carboxylate 3-dehydrogenase (decarboxylating)